ncbi:response regulator [Deinococcus psychrotolerans]|uniref:Response regulator n=2 Tax=Deinococcus TaxID=1298 RepID=A0A553V120_9DEIO|nr:MULTISPECIES: response regulator [Deinococcus]AZI42101.1 response regulator [Deinococcus psychrotolerans]TSA86115.1 response regulator [Deinococcus detaillensis]
MRTIEILLVEDNPADVMLTEEAFEEARIANRLHVARDGVEALEFLRQQGNYQTAPMPDVILLDVNMPRMNGLELLAVLKADPELRRIPTIMLTTSRAEADVWRSYDLHVNAYIPKPVSVGEFFEVVRTFETFWLAIVALPPHNSP